MPDDGAFNISQNINHNNHNVDNDHVESCSYCAAVLVLTCSCLGRYLIFFAAPRTIPNFRFIIQSNFDFNFRFIVHNTNFRQKNYPTRLPPSLD